MKTINIFQINYLRNGYNKEEITKECYKEASIQYNEALQPIREEHFNVDGKRNLLTLCLYNELGQLSQSEMYDADDEMVQRTRYRYDTEGRTIEEMNCYGEGLPEYGSHYIYEDNLLVRQDAYDEDVFSYTEKIFEYQDNRLYKEIDFTEEGEKQYVIEQEFNEKGLLTKRIRHELLEKDRRTFLYEYDHFDHKIKELILNYNEELIAKIYYSYNEKNQLTEVEEEDLDHYKKLKYYYTDNLVSKIEEYDKEDKLQQWTAYSFDDSGHLLKSETYHFDEIDPETHRLVHEVLYETE